MVDRFDALVEGIQRLIEEWRATCAEIGPHLEGAAFQQCADQLAALLPAEGDGEKK